MCLRFGCVDFQFLLFLLHVIAVIFCLFALFLAHCQMFFRFILRLFIIFPADDFTARRCRRRRRLCAHCYFLKMLPYTNALLKLSSSSWLMPATQMYIVLSGSFCFFLCRNRNNSRVECLKEKVNYPYVDDSEVLRS